MVATLYAPTMRSSQRISQAAARYTPAGGREKCGACRHFVSQGACTRILGPVSPRGWCKLFSQGMEWRSGGAVGGGTVATDTSLDLNFVLMGGTLDPRVTFTRASTATYFDSTGTLQTAATNVPRFDADPVTHASRGLLLEETRTNLLLNSATLGPQSVATTAQAYWLSFYGTGSVTLSGSASSTTNGTGATMRTTALITPAAGTMTVAVSGSVTNAQFEAGAFATSYIPTAGATATRAADVATIASIPGRNSSAETFAAEFLLLTSQHPDCAIVADAASGKAMIAVSSGLLAESWDAAAANQTANALSLGAVAKAASSWASPNNGRLCLNGGAVASVTTQTTGFAAVSTIKLMDDSTGTTDQANGYFRRFRYWGRVLSTTEMQQVTT